MARPSYRLRGNFLSLLLPIVAMLQAGSLPAFGQGQSVSVVIPGPNSSVTNLSQVLVTFIKPVIGVQAEDLILNGSSGTNVTGSGTTYIFGFSPPTPGAVEASWNGGHNITDLLGNRLSDLGANTIWEYTLIDVVPPTVVSVDPFPGSTLGHLTQVTINFSEPVAGVDAADLLLNGQPASSVTGTGGGPYVFSFPPPTPGNLVMSWAPNHGIHDLATSPNPFAGGSWSYALHPGEFGGDVIINEFLVPNLSADGLRDEDGDLQDWIELYNRGLNKINLNGWSLSSDQTQPGMWIFPSVVISPGQYLVVFVSGKDRAPTNGGNLHTNFKLNSGGQYLGLFDANLPRDVATQFLPAYPEQRPDISYGLYGGAFVYLTNATPRAANQGPAFFNGVAADPQASVASGFFNRPFSLTLSTETPGASIRYTLDGSQPTPTAGLAYTGPVTIAGNASNAVVNVRAVAYRPDLLSSHVQTHSYIFPVYVLSQTTNPPGFPDYWMTQTNAESPNSTIVPADYGMDPRIFTNSSYALAAAQGLTNLPTLSVVSDIDNLFDQSIGIYANPNPALADRPQWERPASAELILPDGSSGFRVDAGLRIHGSTSRDPNWTRKHSFRLLFKDGYDGTLEYSMFADSPAKKFHTLVVSAGFNVSWNDRYEAGGTHAQFVRDAFCSDLQLAMGRASVHGRFVNLYVNGLYWGLYNVHERPDDHYAATYFGGDNSEYDVVRNTQGFFEVIAGDTNAWNSMMALVNGNLSDNNQYQQLQQYLDVDSLIDYMIVNQYAGNIDWANHNWYAFRRRVPGAGFEFISWDAEITMRNVTEDVTGYNQAGTPTMIASFLRNNSEYRLKFADHVQKLAFNGGPIFVNTNNPAIDPANSQNNRPGALFMKRINEIYPAVTLESARWGDSVPARVNNPFTRDGDFIPELTWMTNTYFPQRTAALLGQYRTEGLYSPANGVTTPVFSQQGGNVYRAYNLTMSAAAGTIYYTTNGTDPRVFGSGQISSNALAYTGQPLVINNTVEVQARAFDGVTWSPLNDATFSVAQLLLPIRITELMYQPIGGDTYQYVELQNLGTTTVDLTGWSISGISFIFPTGFTVSPGGVIVLASDMNPAAFAARYPTVNVAAYFNGKLAKSGERIAVKDSLGRAIIAVNYSKTNGWPVPPTDGYSIEINDPTADPDDPTNWRLSASLNGTPGTISALPPPNPIQINEIMAVNTGALTNGGTTPSWIELANHGTTTADLSAWSLSNDSNPFKFVFPNGTGIAAGGYLLVYCDTQTNAPGLHTGFGLSSVSEHIFLYDSSAKRIDGVSFGKQVPNMSLGRVGGVWQLTVPTPGANNIPAAVSSPSPVVINEWLANSAPGQYDWLELYNPSSSIVSLRGSYLGLSNALFQITSYTFLPPGGYIQLIADELPGPNHLDFHLPAEGDFIALSDPSGLEINRVTYGPQLDGISQGRLPDGSPNIVSFPGTASPGTTNFVLAFNGPRLNEILARNGSTVVNPWGGFSDFIELYNPTTNFDLSGMSLSVDPTQPGQWVFPAGTIIPAGSFMTIWCDGSRSPTTNFQANLNFGQSLAGSSGGVYMFNQFGQVVDYVEYGFQVSGKSIGRAGGTWRLMANPTPGAINGLPASLGNAANLRFNEWMAEPSTGDPWFELYNLDPQPVDMTGVYLTADPSLLGQNAFTVAPLSFISGQDWVVWNADGHPSHGRNHVNFTLQNWGDSLRLYNVDSTLIDAIDFGVQQPDRSEGRLPDGAGTISGFTSTSSPGEANYLALTNIVINEVLSRASLPLEQAIELANVGGSSVNIGGWYLSESQNAPQKYRIPDGTILPPNGYKVFYQYQFNPNPGTFPSFTLSAAQGAQVYLSVADSGGNLTGYRSSASFGPAEMGVSFGRFTNSTGIEFVAQSRHTFGADSPANVGQFRGGTGLVNAYPKVGPVVINELMYHPATVVGTNLVENPDEEFVELFNLSSTNVALFDPAFPGNTWQLSSGINFSFPSGFIMLPQSYLLVVDFDPAANPATLSAFRARYGVSTNVPIFGPYAGRLSDEGESIELYKPDSPALAPSAGFIPFILVDRVNYLPATPWPTAAAGGGASLQRRIPGNFGNDPLNWQADSPSAGRTNTPLGIVPPVITRQPDDQAVNSGASATLSVTVSGTYPILFRWQRNGIDLSYGTNSVLIITNAQPSDAGSYQVLVTNVAGAIYSQPAIVTVFQPPLITSQPKSQSVAQGGNCTFKVTATGSLPMLYQWYFNNSPLSDGTNATLALTQVNPLQAGWYRVVITNNAGWAGSSAANLKVVGADSDGDGIPDAWMIQNFGHPTGLASDHSRAQDDPDGDGMSNLQEYIAGTDPLDAQSCLKLRAQSPLPGGGQAQFSFTAVAGIDYTLLFSDKTPNGPWRRLRDLPADPTTRMIWLNDPGAAYSSSRFYRVVTPMQAYVEPDTDGDGIPDSWMVQFFGHPTGLASDHSRAQDDADGDHMTNLQEYLAGTDPRDPKSNLKLVPQGMNPATGRPQFVFTAMPGLGYTLQYSDDNPTGPWRKVRDIQPDVNLRIITLDDPGASGAPTRFYRVATPIQP
jgi:hypothetical protein